MIDTDPFATGLFGGLPKTATSALATSTADTTVRGSRNGHETSSSGPETKSSSELPKVTRRSLGDIPATGEMGKKASSAPFSATKGRTSRRSLSDRLTLSLISAGLVCGITPSSTRKQSGQPIQVLALDMPDGDVAARRPSASSCSSESDHIRSALAP